MQATAESGGRRRPRRAPAARPHAWVRCERGRTRSTCRSTGASACWRATSAACASCAGSRRSVSTARSGSAIGGAGVAARRAPPRRAGSGRRLTVACAYAISTTIKLAIGRQRPAVEDLPHLMATPTGLSFPSSHATSSFAAARAYEPPAARGAAVRGRRHDGRHAHVPRCPLSRRTSRPGARWERSSGASGDEGRHRRDAQRGQVIAVQRADEGRQGGGGELPLHDDRAERRGRRRVRDERLERARAS